jgi:hypothetical protein
MRAIGRTCTSKREPGLPDVRPRVPTLQSMLRLTGEAALTGAAVRALETDAEFSWSEQA